MAKVNVNTASREELIEAGGLRPEIVDEILKLRRKEKIAGVEVLDQVPGVGPATLEQLRKALDFGDPEAGNRAKNGNGDDRGRERGGRGAEETAREAAGTTASVVRAVPRAAEATGEAARAATHRSAEGAAELGQALVELVQAQTRQNLETWTALAGAVDWDRLVKAVDWDRVLEIQHAYLQASVERLGGLTQRYLELTQAAVAAADDAGRRQARRAA